jgi:hypothetical protein
MSVLELNWTSRVPRLLFRCRVCPLCSSIEFRRDESGPMDGLLRHFALKPVRCVNCWRKYYCFDARGAAL